MKITIIENELYLAQSIAAKLNQVGYDTEIFTSIKEASINSTGDVYLVSANLPGQSLVPIITKFSHKIIILMVNYVNHDTVSIPLQMGAKDYIVKPFMMEELQRKIEHYKEYQELKKYKELYRDYSEYQLKDINVMKDIDKLTLPVVITTNYMKFVDKLAFEYANIKNRVLVFVPLDSKDWEDKIKDSNMKHILYIADLQILKKSERDRLFELLENRDFIIASSNFISTPYKSIELNTDNKLYNENEILTINDYVRFVVTNFQNQFPDTELSKKLGISRKSLWEKRKKYGLFKKK
jgi:DNA-binding NtrC family response regulator